MMNASLEINPFSYQNISEEFRNTIFNVIYLKDLYPAFPPVVGLQGLHVALEQYKDKKQTKAGGNQ